MKTYQDIFTGEGRLEGVLHLVLHLVTDDTVTPVKLLCRKWPLSVRENIKRKLERLTKMEIVTPVDTPTDEENKTTTEHIFLTDVEKEIEEINMVNYVSVSAKCLTELQTATVSDKQLCRLMKIIMSG